MTKNRSHAAPAPVAMPAPSDGLEAVVVTLPDFVSNGANGHYAVGETIRVTPAQAASLRLQGCAK